MSLETSRRSDAVAGPVAAYTPEAGFAQLALWEELRPR